MSKTYTFASISNSVEIAAAVIFSVNNAEIKKMKINVSPLIKKISDLLTNLKFNLPIGTTALQMTSQHY